MDPVQEHGELTQNILSFVTTQVGSFGDWQNIPGSLVMIQASSAGYVWGVNSVNLVYVCKQPCAGGWTPVELETLGGPVSSIQALQVDATYAYILVTVGSTQSVAYRSVDGTGAWTVLSNGVSGKPILSSLGVTQTFLWVTGTDPSTSKPISYHCTKPCSTNAWVQDTDIDQPIGALSSSGSKLYGTTFDPTLGKSIVFSADETGANLEAVAGLSGVNPAALSAQSDQTTLLVAGKDNTLYGCAAPCTDPSQAYRIDTQGYTVSSTSNPVSIVNNQMWMVSPTSATNGNIFARLDTPDATSILDQVQSMDASRQQIAKTLEDDWTVQTASLAAQKEIKGALNALGEAVSMDKELKHSKDTAGVLERKIQSEQSQVDAYRSKVYPLQILAIALLASVVVLAVLGRILPSSMVRGLVALMLTVGFGATIYFYVTNNTDGKSAIQSILPSP
jgi:hypothetical protein